MMKHLICTLLLLWTAGATMGRGDSSHTIIRTDTIIRSVFIPSHIRFLTDLKDTIRLENLRSDQFLPYNKKTSKKISKKAMSDHYLFLFFELENGEEQPRSFYFSAGMLCKETHLYAMDTVKKQWIPLPDIVPGSEQAYRQINLPPGTPMKVLAKVKFAKTNVTLLKPVLVNERFLSYHISFEHNNWFGINKLTYLLCGALVLMLLFSMVTYLQNRKPEFLFYSLYAACLAVLLYLKAAYFKLSVPFNFFNEEYLDLALLLLGYIFYLEFTRKFLDTRTGYPLLNRLFQVAALLLAGFLATYTYLYLRNGSYNLLSAVENYSKYFMFLIGLSYVILGIMHRNRLMNYLVAGNLVNLLLAGFSQYLIVFNTSTLLPRTGIFRQSLLYFEVGILLEMMFFLAGLAYKNRKELIEKVLMQEALRQEKERQTYERKLAVLQVQQQERNRISADMHDELGSGVTAIRLLSELAIKKTKEQPLEELARISFNANDLMVKMNGIIWSMNSVHDTLDSFVAYIRAYVTEYCEAVQLNCGVDAPQQIPKRLLPGHIRRNLFLVVKETLNNIVKHAQASTVTIRISCNEDLLQISISDNGRGFQPTETRSYNNGLRNMRRRMEAVNGTFSIEPAGNGTQVTLLIPMDVATWQPPAATPPSQQ